MINDAGKKHDWTKTHEPYRSNFYRDLCNTIEGRIKFEDGQWNKDHYALERHHLLERCPDDVNLIDVIEMICDCVCAGMARSGEVRDLEISEDILAGAGGGGSQLSTGGMATKLAAARICMRNNTDMMIVNSAQPAILYDVLDGKAVGTHFIGRITK